MYRFFTKECLNIGRRLHAWRARLILIQTKHSSGTRNTLKPTTKLCFFPAWYHKRIYRIKDLISDKGEYLPFDVIYQTRERVFHQDIQTPRSGLKKRGAAEFF